MNAIDPRSFLLMTCLLGSLCAVVMLVTRRSLPASVRGAGEWSVALGLAVCGGLLLGLRGLVNEFLSIVVANTLLAGSLMMMLVALRRFAGGNVPTRALLTGLAFTFAGMSWFTFVQWDYASRVIIQSIVNCPVLALATLTIWRIPDRSLAERFTTAVAGLLFGGTLVRAVLVLVKVDPSQALYQNNVFQSVYMGIFTFSVIALSLGFLLMLGNRMRETLTYLATRDSMTGAYSRGMFFDLLNKEIRRARRSGDALALMIVDLDNFKRINDEWGHPTGDRVIEDFTRIARTTLRDYDLLGRYGGDEFVIILPATSLPEAGLVAERIRANCAGSLGEGRPPYTVSIGLSGTRNGEDNMESLLSAADRALYQAKKAGRNRIGTMESAQSRVATLSGLPA